MSGPDRPAPTALRVEYERNPGNVGTDHPRFSWRLEGASEQSAYRVLVARSRDALGDGVGDAWDSGRVDSPRSVNVPYGGADLAADATYYWTVRAWDGTGEPTAWSEPGTFATALGGDHEWAGEWIAHQPDGGDAAGWRSAWSPADDPAEEWVQVDLGGLAEFTAVDLAPADPIGRVVTPDDATVIDSRWREDGAFGFPEGYRIEAANDPSFDDARTLTDRVAEEGEGTRTVEVGPTAARYVRVTATDPHVVDPLEHPFIDEDERDHRLDLNAWAVFALAGLAVRDDDGTDLARGRPVRASSSHEARPWARSNLVDGSHESAAASSSPLLRTEIELDDEVERARIHVATPGYGELYVNGERVGDEKLNPGWTKYDERVLYSTYDVADLLEPGDNALGLWLGRGWFGKWGLGSPRARLHLAVEYPDGTVRTAGTDGNWRAAASPIRENDIYDGEVYDAREEQAGWAEPGFDDADWDWAAAVDGPGGDLSPQRSPPIRVTGTIEPDEVRNHEDGPVIDFGQNHTGWLELEIEGAERGDEISIGHAEGLTEDGGLSTVDLRDADATDTYIAAGEGTEVYEPRFTYHGYRYAQIEGYPGDLDPGDVRSKVVHTDFDSIGTFECSNDDLDQVQHASRWGLLSNAHSVPTDCPQRSERLGWTGDAQLAARALMYNFDALGFHEKWMDDHDDQQSPAGYLPPVIPHRQKHRISDPTWTITQVVVPWYLYLHYGDRGVLEDHYETMRRYVDYWHSVAEDGVVPDEYGLFGDWVAFENTAEGGRRGLPFDLFNTAFHYRTTNLFARIADVLGNEADAERYGARADAIADAFNGAFFDPATDTYGPGTQSAYAIPLFHGIVPEDHVDDVVANLAEKVREEDDGQLRTGFLGTRALIHALADHGEAELAYRIVSQPEQPGWVYMVRQDATTIWERWNSDELVGEGMNSFNHSPFTLVSEWFYRVLAGIRLNERFAAEREVTVEPAFVDDLDWARGSVDTPHGTVASDWERTDDGIALDVSIPPNVTGAVRLPAADAIAVDGETIRDGTEADALPEGVDSVAGTDDGIAVRVAPGDHAFVIERPP